MNKYVSIFSLLAITILSGSLAAKQPGFPGEIVALGDDTATIILNEPSDEVNKGDWIAIYKIVDGLELEIARGEASDFVDGTIISEIDSERLEVGLKAIALPRAPVHECDELASIPGDTYALVAEGVEKENLDVSAAIEACKAALEEYPYESRFHAQLGRALELDGKPASAVLAYEQALKLNPFYPIALHRLASIRYYGPEELRDYEVARKRFQLASELGHKDAMQIYGSMCRDGQGGDRDFNSAAKWFQAAAENGFAYAQNALGECYEFGWGVEQDIGKALLWYRSSTELDFTVAMYNLGRVFDGGIGVVRNDEVAFKWYGKAAAKGNANALYSLGLFYKRGRGTEPHFENAFESFTLAAQQGHAGAMREIASIYYNGEGVKRDYDLAAIWYEKAANIGDADSQYSLGMMLEKGHGLERSRSQAIRWYRHAAQQGHNSSQKRLLALKANW